MSEMLRIAANVGTPLAFLGLVVAFVYFLYSRKLKFEEKKLEAMPPEELATRTDEYLTRYAIDGKNLRIEDKVRLISDEMNTRHRRSLWYLIVAAIVFIVCFGLAVLAYLIRGAEPGPTSQMPPKMLSTLPDMTSLPESVFKEKDDQTKPRQWEKYLTNGMRREFTLPVIVYLVTEPFPNPPFGPFTLHVNVNTTETVLPAAFLTRLEAGQTVLMPLAQADKHQGARVEYRYAVPAISRKDDQLVVILGMERQTYDHIEQATKFSLSSQPLKQ